MGYFEWSEPIDQLTNSIQEVATGRSLDTDIFELEKSDLKLLTKKNGWKFKWRQELVGNNKVYKLVIKGDAKIQGLICLRDAEDHVFMPLIENAPHNFGRGKQFYGVAGNLIAFACKRSFELGYEGEVGFESKTELIEHYQTSLGACVLMGRRMAILSAEAQNLVSLYFKDFRL